MPLRTARDARQGRQRDAVAEVLVYPARHAPQWHRESNAGARSRAEPECVDDAECRRQANAGDVELIGLVLAE